MKMVLATQGSGAEGGLTLKLEEECLVYIKPA